MTNFLNKKFSLIFGSALICTTPFAFTSCGSSNAIQLANFESYMDPVLMDHLQAKYDVQYQWYTVAEMIETKFRDTYDIAIPCGYALKKLQEKDWLEKITWSNFHIPGVSDSNTAMSLFAPDVQNALKQMNNNLGINVLDYGIPYFAQSFTFIYKGDELTFYKNGTTEVTTEPNWSDIFYTISPQNPKLDSRFNKRIGMLDDSKSIFDVSRIMQTIEQYPRDVSKWTNEMPEDSSIDSLKRVFESLTSKAKTNWYTLNTDSGIIARNLADHSSGGYVAALSWSGDALYAAQGAGEFDPYSGKELHVMKPSGVSLDEIDFVVINKKNESNPNKLDRIYKLIYDLCLDAWNAQTEEDLLAQVGDHYKYWSMQNWDTVNYIPVLNNMYNKVTLPSSQYWNEDADQETRELYTSLIKIPSVKSLFGKPLTPLQNSNTHWAWLEARGKL